MSKLKLEKITGVVALAYLILIPVGAFYVWKKVEAIDNDLTELWEKSGMPPMNAKPIINLRGMLEGLRRR